MHPPVLALDGHDGAGKTTLALELATRLGGRYVRPFSGAAGASMLSAAESGDAARAWEIGRRAVQLTLEAHRDAALIVCDRCWLTVFTLVPVEFHAQWESRVPSALCYSDLATTLSRLQTRDEAMEPPEWHVNYLSLYRELAARWQCPIIHTDRESVEASLERLVEWARAQVG